MFHSHWNNIKWSLKFFFCLFIISFLYILQVLQLLHKQVIVVNPIFYLVHFVKTLSNSKSVFIKSFSKSKLIFSKLFNQFILLFINTFFYFILRLNKWFKSFFKTFSQILFFMNIRFYFTSHIFSCGFSFNFSFSYFFLVSSVSIFI